MNPAILLVDDEQGVCSALNRTFRKNNFRVFEANSGEQALHLLANNDIDVVVSDQRMPKMTGTQLLSVVKNRYPKVGRIILSGHSDIQDLQEAINAAEVYRFLPKPWDERQLLETVSGAIPQAISISKNVLPLQRQLVKPHQQLIIDDAIQTKRIGLQSAIEANIFLLEKQDYHSFSGGLSLSYLNVSWPTFSRFKHESIVDLADQPEQCRALFSWYLLSVIDFVGKNTNNNKAFVVDLFFNDFSQNSSLLTLLKILLKEQPTIIFRMSFESLRNNDFTCFLMENYYYNSSILLDLGAHVIDVTELQNTPILYLEMNCKNNAINNHLLTEKRIKMLSDAKKMGVKFILSNDQLQAQHNYAKSIGFDFF
jgi:DNA-binding NarL/FixJ family response regulator